MSERGGRLQSSVLTFGPVGRVVCTLVVLGIPVWSALAGGLFGLVGAAVWLCAVAPRALRDTWRPAALPATDLTRLRDEAARQRAAEQEPVRNHLLFDPDGEPPTRW